MDNSWCHAGRLCGTIVWLLVWQPIGGMDDVNDNNKTTTTTEKKTDAQGERRKTKLLGVLGVLVSHLASLHGTALHSVFISNS